MAFSFLKRVAPERRVAGELDPLDGPPFVPDGAPRGETSPELAALSEPLDEDKTSVYVASQWKLIWWRFRAHKLAMISAAVVLLLYLGALFAQFLAPTLPTAYDPRYLYAPPQRLHLFDTSGDGIDIGLYVYEYTMTRDPETLALTYEVDTSAKVPVRLFASGEPYKLWNLIPMDLRLIGPVDPDAPFYPLGTNDQGQDVFSRIIYGARISLSIGLVGVAVSLLLGVTLGGISGYYGGATDTVLQRVIEFIMSIPTLPLWMALAAAVPPGWGPLRTYFAITVILSLVGWTSLARVVRGRFLSLREEDFVMAAQFEGASRGRIIFRHMLPSFASHIIAALTLAIPRMILAETSLSFLGLGLQPPAVSWGVLLQEAQNVRAITTAPWLLAPGLAVVVAVLSMNFTGDGLRDAADPYGA